MEMVEGKEECEEEGEKEEREREHLMHSQRTISSAGHDTAPQLTEPSKAWGYMPALLVGGTTKLGQG